MSKNWSVPNLAALLLLLTACSQSPADPDDNGTGPVALCNDGLLTGTIRTDRRLSQPGTDCYYQISGSQNLTVAATLSATPGALVLVDPGLRIMVTEGGSIDLQGTRDNPITFAGSVAEHGSWDGFCFGSDYRESTFDNVHILWAGANAAGTSSYQCRGAIGSIADRAPVNITNSIVFGSRTTGIEATTLTLGDFSGNQLSGNQEYGIRVSGENVGTLDTATDYSGSRAVLPDGTVTPNGIPFIYIRPGSRGVTGTDRVHVWKNPGVAYHLASDAPHYTTSVLDIAADTRILVEEGTTILVGPDISVSVKSGAVLHLSGTEEKPVIMTADSSDARPGHWKGIVFQDGGLIAQHAAILYGGQNSGVSRAKGTLAFWDSGATRPCSYVGNSTIAYSETYGLQISGPYSGAVHLDSSTTDFSGNILDDVLGTATGPAVATIEEALACRQ